MAVEREEKFECVHEENFDRWIKKRNGDESTISANLEIHKITNVITLSQTQIEKLPNNYFLRSEKKADNIFSH